MLVRVASKLSMKSEALAFLKGKYQLHRVMGKNTYWGTKYPSGEPVIVKKFDFQDDKERKQQLLDLGQKLKKLHHRHLVPVLDNFIEAGQFYLVYEYIPGQSLGQLLQVGLVFSQNQALRCICQIGAGLRLLHNLQLQHLNVNPDNIILCKDSSDFVLIDFSLKSSASFPGSGEKIPTKDIYALAETLYALLTGKQISVSGYEKLPRHINPSIAMLIQEGLGLDPQKRPQTVKAWLSPLLAKQPSPVTLPPTGKESKQSQPQPQAEEKQSMVVGDVEQLSHLETESEKLQPSLSLNNSPSQEIPETAVSSVNSNQSVSSTSFTDSLRSNLKQKIQGFVIASKVIWDGRKFPNFGKKESEFSFPSELNPLKSLNATILKPTSVLKVMLLTSAIATSAGVGFGLAVRTNRPQEAGASILHEQQAFPPQNQWPISDAPLEMDEINEQ